MSIKFEFVQVVGFEHAIRGLHNTMSFAPDKSDSYHDINNCYIIGSNDLDMLERFSMNVVGDHTAVRRDPLKLIRMYADITAPLYFWLDFDINEVTSIYDRVPMEIYFRQTDFTIDDFSTTDSSDEDLDELKRTIDILNTNLHEWIHGHRTETAFYTTHRDHYQILHQLPLSYNHRRTVDISYRDLEVIYRTYYSRPEQTPEWREFTEFVEQLPYSELITAATKEEERLLKEEARKIFEAKRQTPQHPRTQVTVHDDILVE